MEGKPRNMFIYIFTYIILIQYVPDVYHEASYHLLDHNTLPNVLKKYCRVGRTFF